jgi:hypothetical protein
MNSTQHTMRGYGTTRNGASYRIQSPDNLILTVAGHHSEQDLQRQVSLTKSQLRDLRMSNESNQAKLLDHSQRQDQEVVAKLAEVDMIVADLERANSRVATVERRNVCSSIKCYFVARRLTLGHCRRS